MDAIPNLFQAFFSILESGKSIPAHNGPYAGYLRYHLALMVPQSNPPTIRVKDQYHTWKEGESILFDDTWNHEVVNDSDSIRTVLIVDIMRPMPLPLHLVNALTVKGLSRGYGKRIKEKIEVKNALLWP